ncbi:MAG TPA: phage antirepressor protein [Bacteroidales bacterium]|nr:phage antirepressor protein [Bacteroidales bacterium]
MAKEKLPKKQDINKIAIFEGEEIRKVFFDDDWYFVIEDVVKTLTDSIDPKGYIKDMRRRDEEISKGWGQIATPLPLNTNGGKQSVNCANTEGILRIIQSIPSKKAEPFKRWLARVGKERLDEIEQPSKAIERAKGYYLAKGYSPQWVETRTASVETRHKFTDTLKDHGITKGYEYAVLTNEMYKSWSDFTAKDYKAFKGISTSDSLRDNMTPLELATTIFNEATITEIIEKTNVEGFVETRKVVHIAGSITKEAIAKIEKQTGKKVVTHDNAKELDSPEIRKELAQNSLPENKKLSKFNESLKKALDYNPKKDK